MAVMSMAASAGRPPVHEEDRAEQASCRQTQSVEPAEQMNRGSCERIGRSVSVQARGNAPAARSAASRAPRDADVEQCGRARVPASGQRSRATRGRWRAGAALPASAPGSSGSADHGGFADHLEQAWTRRDHQRRARRCERFQRRHAERLLPAARHHHDRSLRHRLQHRPVRQVAEQHVSRPQQPPDAGGCRNGVSGLFGANRSAPIISARQPGQQRQHRGRRGDEGVGALVGDQAAGEQDHRIARRSAGAGGICARSMQFCSTATSTGLRMPSRNRARRACDTQITCMRRARWRRALGGAARAAHGLRIVMQEQARAVRLESGFARRNAISGRLCTSMRAGFDPAQHPGHRRGVACRPGRRPEHPAPRPGTCGPRRVPAVSGAPMTTSSGAG